MRPSYENLSFQVKLTYNKKLEYIFHISSLKIGSRIAENIAEKNFGELFSVIYSIPKVITSISLQMKDHTCIGTSKFNHEQNLCRKQLSI